MKNLFIPLLLLCVVVSKAQERHSEAFVNPLLPSGADPWVITYKGHYYYTHTTGKNLTIWKTKNIVDLKNVPRQVVWTPPQGTSYSKELWAPELHHIRGKWYFYFAADDGNNINHRMYVLENKAKEPTKGKWVFKGQVNDPSNKWAIDGNVFEHRGILYMIWSGWEGDTNGQQNIYIAKMKNPWTIIGERVKISSPDFDWEKHGNLGKGNIPNHVNVNEGPQFLTKAGKIFIVYSASGCWTDFYALGMLSAGADSDPMQASSWFKSPKPVFQGSPENGAFAPGHNSFFKSPDGKEDWILYHANSAAGQGCGGKRSPRAQRFSWDEAGMPNFGMPLPIGTPLAIPSGSKK